MTKSKEEKWQEICADTAKRMIVHVQPYLSPISRVLSEKEGEHLGSGSYIEVEGKKYIITNEHVAKHLSTHSLTHQFKENDSVLRLTKPVVAEAAPVDVAISEIPDSSWSLVEHSGLTIPEERFAATHSPAEHECLFFAGYSGERSKFLFEHLITPGTPYLTQQCPFPQTVKEADEEFHFSLFYPPDLATSIDGTSHLPDPHGFSGSLVWDTKRVACLKAGVEWSPEMAEVTGIVWGWPSSEACILATKVEHINLKALISQEVENA
ncbi:hypothetical protein EXT48_07460 [Pseudoalteromonas sp. CO348]|nr:hypothetical protein EXT48_07460 [Pseudoalteromonas sp. CO348]